MHCSNLFAVLPLEAEGGSFSLTLSIANAIGSELQIQHANAQLTPKHTMFLPNGISTL